MVGVWSLPTDSDSGESVGSGAHGGTFRAMSTTFSASTANDKRCHSLALDKESLESELVLEHSLKRQHNAMHKAGLEAMAARVADLESKLELVASETTVRTEKVSELLALLAKKDGEIATLRSAMSEHDCVCLKFAFYVVLCTSSVWGAIQRLMGATRLWKSNF
jgi:hypothetical protein